MKAPGSLSGTLPAIFGGILLRYVFENGTELHLFLHELFRPDIHQIIKLGIAIHGPARIEMPRPGRFV